MNIAYIGFDNECTTKICNYLTGSHSITLFTNRTPTYELDCDVVIDKSFWAPQVFSEKNIDVVIYNDINNNYTLLNNWLSLAEGKAKHFIIVCQDKMIQETESTVRIEQLLKKAYSQNGKIKISILNVSELYGTHTAPGILENIILNLNKDNAITIPSGFCEICDALHIDDFCVFLEKFLEKIDSFEPLSFNVQSGYSFRAKELVHQLAKRYPQAINLFDEDDLLNNSVNSSIHLDGWSPKHSFIEEINSIIDIIEEKSRLGLLKKRKAELSLAAKLIAFVFSFLAVELYTSFISVASDLQYVDLRLGFIAICAVVFGKRYSIFASICCGIASIIQCLSMGYSWHVIFYNVNNWIPLAIYIVFAMLIGAYADKIRNTKKK
jgi:hypothetical protein